ncbi:putative toxin-antitoxin system toxin component, PIN family [Ekhidna sp.]|uniref:putative toxin-antitoxin system toxin component, PIN family n=1 Tax=Ekhidna sp. TaxID=2608089 RepID=UPI003CCB7955
MQKIIVDTNVIVSSLISKGYPFKIINDLILKNVVEVQLSDELFKEYMEVLSRPKFSKYPEFVVNAEIVLFRIYELSNKITPKKNLKIIHDDNDNRLLELAIESRAQYLITGNSSDFTFDRIEETIILSPTEYWQNYRPNHDD